MVAITPNEEKGKELQNDSILREKGKNRWASQKGQKNKEQARGTQGSLSVDTAEKGQGS